MYADYLSMILGLIMKFLKYGVPFKGLINFLVLASMQTVLATPNATVNSSIETSSLIGTVFHDLNENGYLDNQEQGIAGVRLFTLEGLMIETDAYGRFHIADSIDNALIKPTNATNKGSVVLKVDQASLPDGSRLTTENPRVLRLSNAGINKINFGIRF